MSTLRYQELILEQMHARALRGVMLTLALSGLFHLAITLIQWGGDSFGFKRVAPDKPSDALTARIAPRAQPQTPPKPIERIVRTPKATEPTPRAVEAPPKATEAPPPPLTPAPQPTEAPTLTMQPRIESNAQTITVAPIVPTSPLAQPVQAPPKVELPDPPPAPTRAFDAATPPRVTRDAVQPLQTVTPVQPLETKPLPAIAPLELPAPKQVDATAAEKKSTLPDATKDATKSLPTDAARAAASDAPPAPANAPSPVPAAATPTLSTAQPSAAASPPASNAAAGAAQPSSGGSAPAAAGSASGSAARGASVTLPGPRGDGASSVSGAASSSSAPGANAQGAGASDPLRPGMIDGFDPNAARRNAARAAANDLNGRRSLVPPSVAPSPTAREREAKAIENAIREDCKEVAKDIGLLAIPSVVSGVLTDKGCRVR